MRNGRNASANRKFSMSRAECAAIGQGWVPCSKAGRSLGRLRGFASITLLLLAFGARAESVANWADTTTEIATDGPNTIRTMALAQNAVYEAVNAITARYPRDRVDLGPTQGASIDAAIAAASRTVLLHEAPALKDRTETVYA